jgi:hypothetical protein
MKSRIKKNFGKYKNVDLLFLGEGVYEQMTTNKKLFTPEILQIKDQLKPMCVEFNVLIEKAKVGTTADRYRRDEYQTLFIRQLNMLAEAINADFKGNDVVLESTGFEVIRVPHNLLLGSITGVNASQSRQKGYLDVKMLGGENYKSIKASYTIDINNEESVWETAMFTKKSFSLGPFKTGDVVHIGLTAYGKDNSETESEVIKIGVQ